MHKGNGPRSNKQHELVVEEESRQIKVINIVEIELQIAAMEQMQFVWLSDPAPVYTDENPD